MMAFRHLTVLLIAASFGCTVTVRDNRPPPPPPPPEPVVVVDQPAPPPPQEQVEVDTPPDQGGGDVTVVTWYQGIPDKGHLDDYLPAGFQGEVHLDPGRYHLRGGEIKFYAGGLRLIGSGHDQTFIEGSIKASGDNYVFRGLTVTGNLELRGNNSEVACYVQGARIIHGRRVATNWNARPDHYGYGAPPPPPQPEPQAPPPPQPQNPPPPPPNNNGKLPDKGLLESYLPGFRGEFTLQPGIYKLRGRKIKFERGGLTIRGSGKENTFIDGDVEMIGDGYVFTGLTINGSCDLHGNNCTGDVFIKGHKTIKGANNRGW